MQRKITTNTNIPDTLVDRLLHYAQTTPMHDAIVTPSFTLTYQQFAAYVFEQVSALKAIGISDTTTVGIHCSDDTQHLILTLAASYLGATSCTIPSYENHEAQQAIRDHCGVTHLLDESISINLTKPIHPIDFTSIKKNDQDACLLFSTSGSTGTPKLVMHHDRGLVAQAHRHVGSAQERFTCPASMEHNFAKRHRLYCLAMGASNVFLSGELENVVEDCIKLAVNVMHVSAFQAQELLHLPNIKQLAHIKLKLGGSHVPEVLRNALRTNITPTLQAGYGTTETGAIGFTDPRDQDAGESVGQALPGIEIRCVDQEHKPVKLGERGEVAIRCKGMFCGYYKQPELTAQRLDNDWFYTGDTAYLDAQQRIHLCGRSDDMFTFNSMNIYPQEIESEIRQFPGIIDALVMPKASAVHGNIPIAMIVFNPTMKLDLLALRKFVEKRVGVRHPRHYTLVDKIPTKHSGKISRTSASKLTEKSDQIRQALINLLNEELIKSVGPKVIKEFIEGKIDLSYRKLNMDSLDRMNLLVSIETVYDIVIAPHELGRLRSLGKLAARMLSLSETTAKARPIQPPNISFTNVISPSTDSAYIVRYLQRLAPYCKTVAELNHTLAKLDHRFTPLDIAHLDQAHIRGQLLNKHAAEKFQIAISNWLNETKQLMFNSGKKTPEPFLLKRLTPQATLFSSQTSHHPKKLLIGFTPRDVRHMMISNAVLLQHIDASKYDLLIISGVDKAGWLTKTVSFSKKLNQLTDWLKQEICFKEYQQIRTFGYSAGGIPAVAMAYLLGAEMGLCIAGRFHKKKQLFIDLEKIVATRLAMRKRLCKNILFSYSANNSRDKKFAKRSCKIFNGQEIGVKIKDENLSHLILRRLAERGELATYLAQTLFVEPDTVFMNSHQQKTVICFPIT